MLVAAAVFPHGDFVFDPTLLPRDGRPRAEAEELNASARRVAGEILESSVDLIVLITPHGLAAENDVAVYLGERASGYAEVGRDVVLVEEGEEVGEGDGGWEVLPYRVPMENVSLSDDESRRLWRSLEGKGFGVCGLTSFGGYDDVPLRYGEVIPLSFFFSKQSSGTLLGGGTLDGQTGPKCVMLSLPNKRYTHGPGMVPEMASLGSELYRHLESLSDRVAIGDLAHTHLDSGPYGFSKAAGPFDAACARWARSLDEPPLLRDARGLLDDAKSCGYLGLVVLHGALSSTSGKPENAACTDNEWECRLHSISHPTYYGMMVASYSRQQT